MDTAQERMFDVIDEQDIDRFMFDVWKKIPADNQGGEEIRAKPNKSTKEKDETEPKE